MEISLSHVLVLPKSNDARLTVFFSTHKNILQLNILFWFVDIHSPNDANGTWQSEQKNHLERKFLMFAEETHASDKIHLLGKNETIPFPPPPARWSTVEALDYF